MGHACAVLLLAGALGLLRGVAVAAPPAICPFKMPVVKLPPHTVNGFSWGPAIRPMNDPCVDHIAVDPNDDQDWYVGGWNGLYMTKNGGATWSKPLSGFVSALVLIPGRPRSLVYVGIHKALYLSRDEGTHWTKIHTFSDPVGSLTAANGRLYVGLMSGSHTQAGGIWISNMGGAGATFHPFGPGHTGLIVWALARDPQDGTLYAGTEIFDHPEPYHPPFFRSTDGGTTWMNVAGTLPLHVVSVAVRPTDGFVYALTEGPGLFGSANKGATWQALGSAPNPSVVLLMDQQTPTRLFGGRQRVATLNGGAFVSVDGGVQFKPIGLLGVTVADVALNGSRTRLYAAAYASGVYASTIPP